VIFGFSCSVSITDRGGEVVRARRTGHELDAPVRDGKGTMRAGRLRLPRTTRPRQTVRRRTGDRGGDDVL